MRVFRGATIGEPDKSLFEDVVNHLQAETHIRRAKLYKVLTVLSQEAEDFLTAKTQPAPETQPSQPAQNTSSIKYKAPELSVKMLSFPCSPFELIE